MTPVKTPIFSSSLAMPGPPGLGPFSLGAGFLSNTGSKGKGNFLNSEEFVQPTDKPKQQVRLLMESTSKPTHTQHAFRYFYLCIIELWDEQMTSVSHVIN